MKKIYKQKPTSLIIAIFIYAMSINSTFAAELPVFVGDATYPIKQNVLVLDSNDSGGDVSLQFGETLGENIYWDADGGDTTGIFDFSDDVLIEGKLGVGLSAGGNPASLLHIYENTTSADATAGATIENEGTGDSIMQFLLTGVTRWVIGIDNSDSDKFKIAYSADLSSDAAITIDTSGKVGIGTTAPDYLLDLISEMQIGDGTDTDQDILIVDNGDALGNRPEMKWEKGVFFSVLDGMVFNNPDGPMTLLANSEDDYAYLLANSQDNSKEVEILISHNTDPTSYTNLYAHAVGISPTSQNPYFAFQRGSTSTHYLDAITSGSSITEVVVNDSSNDTNFRVEGNNEANLLFTDAGTDRIGIGTAAPVAQLDVINDDTVNDTPGLRINMAENGGAPLLITPLSATPNTTVEGSIYYDSDTDKVYVYANGSWTDMTAGGGTPDFYYFSDTTADASADNNTTDYWDPATQPNIAPSSSSSEILVMVTVEFSSVIRDRDIVSVVNRNTSADPVCGTSTQVGPAIAFGRGSNTTYETASAVFVDSPATTNNVRYTLCSSALTSVASASNLINKIYFTLYEINNAADLAEVYPTNDPSLSIGEVVEIDPDLDFGVKRTKDAYSNKALGVISTKPASVIGGTDGTGLSGVPIAISGRVPVKVTTKNGKITPGDFLVVSDIPGMAMKGTESGFVIGKALTELQDGEGTVIMFVENGYQEIGSDNSIIGMIQNSVYKIASMENSPGECSQKNAGAQWMDSKTGIVYVCDTSNDRNKWLSQQDNVITVNGKCENTVEGNCEINLGYIPQPITITGYGFSQDTKSCEKNDYNLEIWSTKKEVVLGENLKESSSNSKNMNLDVKGDANIALVSTNNCLKEDTDTSFNIYYRWKHE